MRSGDYVVMPFGRHKGQKLTAIDTGYLLWLWREATIRSASLRESIRDELQYRQDELQASRQKPAADLAPAIRKAFREMVLRWHPDRGGDTRAMAALNDFHERLLELTRIQ